MISLPICVPIDRASDLKIPLPTTCSTTEGSSFARSPPFAGARPASAAAWAAARAAAASRAASF